MLWRDGAQAMTQFFHIGAGHPILGVRQVIDTRLIEGLHRQFLGRVRVSFGWGTMLTNDFRGLAIGDALAPFSLVCKAVAADGHPTVKLSDNPNKAMGPADEIARYKRVFGVGAQQAVEVLV